MKIFITVLFLLLSVGAVAYFLLNEPADMLGLQKMEQTVVAPVQQVPAAPSAEVASRVIEGSVDESMHSEAPTPAEEPPAPQAPSQAILPTEPETPSPAAEEPAPAPEPAPAADVDYAPESLNGKRLLCSYLDAEMSTRSDENGDFSDYAPISDNGKGAFSTDVGDIPMLRRLTVFTARTPESAPRLLKYTRTGKNTAEVHIYALMIPDAAAALAISNVVSSIDYLTNEQIGERIGQYFLDSSDTLKLTFTGENAATAEGEYCAGTVENKMRGILVRLEPGTADAVEPEAGAADSGTPSYTNSSAASGNSGGRNVVEDRSSLDPLIARMRALRCRHASSALYQKRLLTLLPMIRNGANVDITLPETKGNTALHYACSIGSLSITRWLLEHGANPNAVTDKGATPLMCVGNDNRAAIMQALRNHGAGDTEGGREQSADYGSAEEDFKAGVEWQFGKNGRRKNFVKAAECYQRAANAGHAAAQNNIGHFYHQGWGVPKNLKQAAYWYRLSAQQGLPLAQSNYGTCLEFGWGVRANLSEAIEWYRKAARQGNPSGQRHLRRLGVSW